MLGVLVLRSNRGTNQTVDDLLVYRTALFNPVVFCAVSGFVVIRSALRHQVQGLILLLFFGGCIVAVRLFKNRQLNQSLAAA